MGRPDWETAFGRYYDHFYKAVYHTALQLLRNTHDAEDVMQETFLALWSQLQQEEPRNTPAWLLQVARNASLSRLRRRRFSAPWEEYVTADTPGITQMPDELLFVSQMLDRLGEEEREIFTLHVIADLKLRDIAKALELPEGTVRWRYSAARKKLKASLEREEAAQAAAKRT